MSVYGKRVGSGVRRSEVVPWWCGGGQEERERGGRRRGPPGGGRRGGGAGGGARVETRGTRLARLGPFSFSSSTPLLPGCLSPSRDITTARTGERG